MYRVLVIVLLLVSCVSAPSPGSLNYITLEEARAERGACNRAFAFSKIKVVRPDTGALCNSVYRSIAAGKMPIDWRRYVPDGPF